MIAFLLYSLWYQLYDKNELKVDVLFRMTPRRKMQ